MTPDEIRDAFMQQLLAVAPDIDPDTLNDDDHLQEDLELDSMDVLNLMSALHKNLGVSIPESDYPLVATPGKAVQYLQKALS